MEPLGPHSTPAASGSERAASSQASERLWRWELLSRGFHFGPPLTTLLSMSEEPGDLQAGPPMYLMSPRHTAMALEFHARITLVQCGSLCRLLPWSTARVDIIPYLCTPRTKVGQRLGWGKSGDACHRCIIKGHQKTHESFLHLDIEQLSSLFPLILYR